MRRSCFSEEQKIRHTTVPVLGLLVGEDDGLDPFKSVAVMPVRLVEHEVDVHTVDVNRGGARVNL